MIAHAPSKTFLSNLERICSNYGTDHSWVLVLFDADDKDKTDLHHEKETKTNLNGIPIDKENDCVSVIEKYLVNIEKQHSYYLGDCLFAMFINNTMKQAVLIVKKLLNDLKNSIHFALSIGMASITGCNHNYNYNNHNNKQELQRKWVSMAYINLLRAKEAGNNCFFNNEVWYSIMNCDT